MFSNLIFQRFVHFIEVSTGVSFEYLLNAVPSIVSIREFSALLWHELAIITER